MRGAVDNLISRGRSSSNKRGVSVKTKRFVFNRDCYRCYYCGEAVTEYNPIYRQTLKTATVDHLRPQADSGSHSITNLVTACQECNSKKGKRSLEAYREHLRFTGRTEGDAIKHLRLALELAHTPHDAEILSAINHLNAQIPALRFAGEAE